MLYVCGRGPVADTLTADNDDAVRLVDEDINDRAGDLKPWDLVVSVGYLRIIRKPVIDACRVINCHYSLLPRHRGRSPVPWAIVEGDTFTGVTWHWIDEGIDTGRILAIATCPITSDETQASLFGKLHAVALDTWPAARTLAFDGFEGWRQCGETSYHRAGPPHGGKIDPMWDDERIERFIRAMTYPPLPYATCNGWQVRNMKEYYDAIKAPTYRA
jgi:methionyl-tRNA formyltransferase